MKETNNKDFGKLIYKNDLPPQRLKPHNIHILTRLTGICILASAILIISPRLFGLFGLIGLDELDQIPRFHFVIALIITLFIHFKIKKLILHQIEVYERGLKLKNYYKDFEILYEEVKSLAPHRNLDGITITPKDGEHRYLKSNKRQSFKEAVDKIIDAYVAHTGKIVHKTFTNSVHGVTHTMTTDQLSEILHSDEMKKFEDDFALSQEKEKYMLMGAYMTLYYAEGESPKTLSSKKELLSKVRLWARWEIKNETTAHQVLDAASCGEMDTPRIEEFFQAQQITGAQRLSKLYLKNPEKYNDLIAELVVVTNGANYDEADKILTTQFGYTETELMGMNLDDLPAKMIMLSVVAQNMCDAYAFLIDNFNYTEEELSNLKSLIALDLARPAYLAKVLLSKGILTEEALWSYIEKAAKEALKTYNSWREFIAAYVIGRTFMYNWIDPSDSKFYAVIDYLLNHPESPYQTVPFKHVDNKTTTRFDARQELKSLYNDGYYPNF